MVRRPLRWLLGLLLCGPVLGGAGTAVAEPAPAAHAVEDAAARGRAIAQDAADRQAGFVDYQVQVRMVLTHPGSGQDVRELRVRNLEMPARGERSLVVFDAPLDQRGTALLTHSRVGSADEQWLFLPALNRVKRIAGGSRSGPFVGSEFAFEDLTEQQFGRYTYRYLDARPLDGVVCDRIERVPLDRDSGYARQIAWYDQEARRLRRIDYFDRRGEPLKTYTATGFRQYAGRWWRPQRMSMDNLQTRKRTELLWGEFRFGTRLDAERDFGVNTLKRVQ